MKPPDKSLAGFFRKIILPEAPVGSPISFFFSDTRPTKELYAVPGAILFQQIFDLTDKKTVTQITCNPPATHSADFPIKRFNSPLKLSIWGEERC